jgi:hypothetical protein
MPDFPAPVRPPRSDTFGDLIGTLYTAINGDPAVCEEYETPECTNIREAASRTASLLGLG